MSAATMPTFRFLHRPRAPFRRWALRLAASSVIATMLVACSSGPVRRVSEPSALVQQLTVREDGQWQVALRIENFSSITMRFDAVDLALAFGEHQAGRLTAQPGVQIGPESADVVNVILAPQTAGKLAVADALAAGRSLRYSLEGRIDATPDEGRQRSFDVERSSQLSPAPGLPGVMR